jgi:hypothetical protein
MYQALQETTKSEPCLQNCLDTARQIDKIMTCTPLDPAANTQWSTVKTELNTLANAFNVPECNRVLLSRGYEASNAFGWLFWKPVAS